MASQVLKWAVPQLIACWDDERMDVDRTLTRIIYGVFHHPALRDEAHDQAEDGRRLMFGVVQGWWESQDERTRRALRDQLSREGVEQGKNHEEGVHDSGHGCGKPLGMPNYQTAASSGALGGSAGGYGGRPAASGLADHAGQMVAETAGGGVLGGLVGSLVGGVGTSLLGNIMGQDDEKKKYGKQGYAPDGSYTQSEIETGHHKKKRDNDQEYYAQAESSTTTYPGGGGRQEYRRYEQPAAEPVSGGYGYQQIQTARPGHGGGYEQTTETSRLRPGGEWETEEHSEGRIDERYQSGGR